MLPSLHRLPATGAKRLRADESDDDDDDVPVEQHLKVAGNRRAIDLQRGIDVRYAIGQAAYNKKRDRLTTVGIAPDSVSGMDRDADERRLMASLEEAELTDAAYNAWFAFLRALSTREDTDKQDMALDALCHLVSNVDVWLDEARVNSIRESILSHPRYVETFHGHASSHRYKEHMERHNLFERLKIYIGDARWDNALTLLYMAQEARSVDMDVDLRARGYTTLSEGYRTYRDIMAHVEALVQEGAERRFEKAAASM